MNSTPWTIAEAHRILDLWENDYIIYNVTEWKEQETFHIHSVLSSWKPSEVKTFCDKGKTIIVRYPESTVPPKAIHLFTKEVGTDVTIPEGQTVDDFIEMYLGGQV